MAGDIFRPIEPSFSRRSEADHARVSNLEDDSAFEKIYRSLKRHPNRRTRTRVRSHVVNTRKGTGLVT